MGSNQPENAKRWHIALWFFSLFLKIQVHIFQYASHFPFSYLLIWSQKASFVLCISGDTGGEVQGTVMGIKAVSATCKANTLTPELSLWPSNHFFFSNSRFTLRNSLLHVPYFELLPYVLILTTPWGKRMQYIVPPFVKLTWKILRGRWPIMKIKPTSLIGDVLWK